MRIYNNTKSQMEFNLTPSRKIVISPNSYSCDFLPNAPFLDMLVMAFTPDQIAFVARSGAELSLCSSTKCTTTGNYVCGDFDEVTEKFGLGKSEKEEKKEEAKEEVKTEGELKEKVIEAAPEVEPVAEPKAAVEEAVAEEPVKKSKKKKKE